MENKIYGLHAVIIKKPIDLEKAKEYADEIIKNPKKKFYRETKQSYRFRNISKQKFIKKSFKTKKIKGKPISIIFGELKPEYHHLEGGGILDFFKKTGNAIASTVKKGAEFVKSKLMRTDNYNNTTTKHLKEFGNFEIKKLSIYRTPIMKILDKALNLISLGKWSDLKKKYGYDELFHLALIADLGHKTVVIEKNEVINVNTSYKTSDKTEKLDVDLKGKVFTINDMFDKGQKNVGDKLWFLYDPFKNNCQYFIKYCLEAEELYGQEEKDFLFQDLSELRKELSPITKGIAKGITTTGAIVNKLTGQGMEGGYKNQNEINDEFYKYIKTQNINFLDKPDELEKKLSELFDKWEMNEGKHFINKDITDLDNISNAVKKIISDKKCNINNIELNFEIEYYDDNEEDINEDIDNMIIDNNLDVKKILIKKKDDDYHINILIKNKVLHNKEIIDLNINGIKIKLNISFN